MPASSVHFALSLSPSFYSHPTPAPSPKSYSLINHSIRAMMETSVTFKLQLLSLFSLLLSNVCGQISIKLPISDFHSISKQIIQWLVKRKNNCKFLFEIQLGKSFRERNWSRVIMKIPPWPFWELFPAHKFELNIVLFTISVLSVYLRICDNSRLSGADFA